jgi:hypothetical protein
MNNNIKWYNDTAAKYAYENLKASVEPIVRKNFPEHELSHVGVLRNPDTDEVVIKLHINPLGRIRVSPITDVHIRINSV